MPFSFLFVSKGAEKAFSAELFASQAFRRYVYGLAKFLFKQK